MSNTRTISVSHVLLLAFLACISVLVYFTPMHSDDYAYKAMGHDWVVHLNHYKNWSGRLVADYISPTLLALDNKFILALIQVTGLLLLIHAIVISTRFVRTSLDFRNFEGWASLLLLSVFFLSVPVFGQVVLWVVGSANYLWTAILYSWFAYFVLKCIYTKEVPVYAYPLALLAGCTNESSSATLLAFVGLAFAWRSWQEKKIDYRLLALLLCFGVGAAVLVGAPGNQNRLGNTYFQDWVALTFIEKLQLHFSDRAVRPFEQSSVSYLVAIILTVVAVRNKQPYLQGGLPTAKALFVVFFAMSLFATCVMALAPTMPPRSLTIPFVFLMFALIFGSIMVLESGERARKFKRGTLFLFVCSAIYLSLLVPAYSSLHKQETFRLALVAAADRQDTVTLPEFHMRKVPVKNSRMYRMDGYNNLENMAHAYGVAKVELLEAGFDYSILVNEPDLNQPKMWRYSESPWQTTFVIQDATSTVGPHRLVVTTAWGSRLEACIQKQVQLGGNGYVYATVSLPTYLIRNYSVEPGCGQ
ncbi:DUF6056 family protein [Achromobacter sp. F4_2707]|uniref:DUF6056 family protein n=1 Tax=Achromobacter sp. F4_2707 TaxID=3114286 RepID=UPI0039C5E26F